MAYADRANTSPSLSPQRAGVVAGVIAVHLAIGYVFVTGMAVDFARDLTRTLTTTNIPLPPAPPPPEPQPQPREQPTAARASQPTAITFVDPVVPAPAANNPVFVDAPPLSPLPSIVPALPEPAASASPPAGKAVGAAARGRADWITTADYPASALRAGDQGRVGVSVEIGANGRVTRCAVTEPSGSATLDAATCRLYAQRARFTPARDDAGRAVASSYTDRVRWQLPRN